MRVTLKRTLLTCLFSLLALMFPSLETEAQETAQAETKSDIAVAVELTPNQLFEKSTRAGVAFLLEKGQDTDGSFSKQLSPAVTAMCTSALLEHGIPVAHPQVQKSLKYLEGLVKPDGGVYLKGSNLRNYETSVAVMCFVRANNDGKYDKTIQQAVGFLKGIQWDEGEGHDSSSTFFGGQGYGKHERPDLSNTSFFNDVMHATGEDVDSAAQQKALAFVSRAQNLVTEHNAAEWAVKASEDDRGGFIYTGAGDGESKVESGSETGGLRSYASMSYAGLKSLLYAGVSKDDIRVKSAYDWIQRHYDLKTNPGMGQQGLYYYYHVFGKSLAAYGQPTLTDSEGVEHNWREDLIKQLASTQNKDGSWINPADRWYEGDPNLVTSYSLLALSYCNPNKADADQNKSGQK